MAELFDFKPIRREDANTVRARVDQDANAGVDPESDLWLDTTPGGFWYDITQAFVLEAVRMWDFLTVELPAAVFPSFSWGEYLDLHGEALDLPRLDEERAVGEVTLFGDDGIVIEVGVEVATVQSDPEEASVTFLTTDAGTINDGEVTLPVEADEPGARGNVPAGAITQFLSPLEGIASVTNDEATAGGLDVETDEDYQARILLRLADPQGAGNIGDYERWALEDPAVGNVAVEPVWAGPGTVRVIVTDHDNRPVVTAVVDRLQATLDPVAGEGRGLAPVGATVTVATPAILTVAVTSDVTLEQGYTVDGALGTIGLQDKIEEAVRDYIDRLRPGEDVLLSRVAAAIISVPGVIDAQTITLNATAANLSVASLEVAQTGSVTLT